MRTLLLAAVDVLNAISKLNAGKGDGNGGLTADHFINASKELSVHVSVLFSGLLTHGTAPEDMSLSTVIPIPKGRNCSLVDRRHVFEYNHSHS